MSAITTASAPREHRLHGHYKTWIHRAYRLAAALCLLAAPAGAGWAEPDAATHQLESVQFSALPGDRVQLTLTLDKPAPQPLSFTIDNPARLVLDLPATRIALKERSQKIGVGMAASVSTAEARGRTRVVMNLLQMVPYQTRVDGNRIIVVLEGGPEAATVVAQQTDDSGAHRVTNVDFRRGEHGEGRVIVTLSDARFNVDLREESGHIVVEFIGTQVPDELERRLDVLDFATPVKNVDTFNRAGNVRLVVDATGDYEHLAYQADNVYTVEVKRIDRKKKEAEEKEKFGYTGERLSLNFQNIEVRAVLQLIADFTGLNVVVSDMVSGNLTLRLKNVPWDQALEIILKTKGLAMRQSGNVVLVAPSEEIAAREKLELEAQKQLEELAPLRSEFVQVNYAKASDIADLLKQKQNSLMSERGNVAIDERTNTLLVQDTADKIEEVRRLVSRLDVPVRQVLIESRIVIANNDFSRELGVRFGGSGVRSNGRDGVIAGTGRLSGTDSIVTEAQENLVDTGDAFPVTVPSLADRLAVNLPVVNPFGTLALAVLDEDILLEMELSAMQAEGRGEVVSNPRVVTANQKAALIEQGVEIPFQEATSSGATSVSFKKAVLSLKVTPQITPDDRVIMDLNVSKDSVGQVFLGVPSINTREVETQVLVDNGETVVLGGIYEQTRSNEVDRVPFFGEIPGLGLLFRQTRKVDDKQELLIFVTPKILKESLTLP